MARPAKAFIDLNALRHNYAVAKSLSAGGQCLAVVKANAYGHGAVTISRALEPSVPAFGVACTEEADELRNAGISKPILLLEGAFTADELAHAAKSNYWVMVDNQSQIKSVLAAKLSAPVKVWLKIDSGMHRLGLVQGEISAAYQQLLASPNVQDDIVLTTHLACADELENTMTPRQLHRFSQEIAGLNYSSRSIANSPGLLAWPNARVEWNRPGYMLFGNSPFAEPQINADQLRPVMNLKSAVIAIRDVPAGDTVGYGATWVAERNSRIATVTMGYGDGYPRHAPNGTPVLVNGQRAKLAGRVSMDMITVDITDLQRVNVGDEVVLWGEKLPVNEVAQWAGTIGYELLTRMPSRVPRIYLE